MSCLQYKNNSLSIENVDLDKIAKKYGTPCYIYSKAKILENWHTFVSAFKNIPHRICYAVKANSNLSILHLLVKQGASFDIVSVGELERVIKAGGDPKKIIFSGVGKSRAEIERAIVVGIYCFDVESESELHVLQTIAAKSDIKINIALRINPHVQANTHPHITTGVKENKFGIDIEKVVPLCERFDNFSHLNLIGIASHIGSQITSLQPLMENATQLVNLYHELKLLGIQLKHINVGGGLGITYHHEHPPKISDYAQALAEKIAGLPLEIILEPGRAIVGNAGALLTKVEYLKFSTHKNYAIVDAGMNDFMRPALYDAWQEILPLLKRNDDAKYYDIAGPVCESADFLGKERLLAIQENDYLAIDATGAYGFSMSSNYNSRCRLPEILVDKDKTYLIRAREEIPQLFQHEKIFAELAEASEATQV